MSDVHCLLVALSQRHRDLVSFGIETRAYEIDKFIERKKNRYFSAIVLKSKILTGRDIFARMTVKWTIKRDE